MSEDKSNQLQFFFPDPLVKAPSGAVPLTTANLSVEARQNCEPLTTEAIEAREDIDDLREVAMALVQKAATLKSPREKLDLFLEAPSCELVVPLLPPEQLFFTMQQVGLSDAVELLHICSPEQFTNFVDLSSWKKDRFDPMAALTWIRAAGLDTDEGRFVKKYEALDVELRGLLFRSCLKIWDLEEDDDPDYEGEVFKTPDGRFVLEYGKQELIGDDVEESKDEGMQEIRPVMSSEEIQAEEQIRLGMRRLIESMYLTDPEGAALFVESVRWELPSELEESAYRWRNIRLLELGFPEMSEALSYFAYVNTKAPLPAVRRPGELSAPFALNRALQGGRFFQECLDALGEEELSQVESQLVALLNAVLVAESIDTSDVAQVEKAMERARDTLALGLEHAASSDEEKGVAILSEASLKRVFQVGMSLSIELKSRLERLRRRFPMSLPGMPQTLLDEPYASLWSALIRKRPLTIACKDILHAQIGASPYPTRPLRNLQELHETQKAVAHLERMADVMAAVNFDAVQVKESLMGSGLEKALPFVRWSDLYLTAVAREAAGVGFSFEPLPAAHLGEFGAEAFEKMPDGRVVVRAGFMELLHGRLRRVAADMSEDHVASAALFCDRCAERLFFEAAESWFLGILHLAEGLPLVIAR